MKKFRPGEDYIKYNEPVFGEEEIKAVTNVLEKGWLVPGASTAEFEKKVGELFGKKYGLMVNSGSSANTLVFETMSGKKGGEVVTPACTFATTLAPILQKGFVPVFVDSHIGNYQINVDEIEKAITSKTVALMVPHLIGNVTDIAKISRIAKKHKILFIEDSCDTLGATFNGKPTGTFSDVSTTSFYASHVITAGGGGGMFLTNNKKVFAKAEMIRSWGRSIPYYWEDVNRRFKTRLNGVPYDGKFIFSEIGYNFLPIEMEAAFGLAQLKKLEHFRTVRKNNFQTLLNFFKQYERFFVPPEQLKEVDTAWLAFPLTIKKGAPFTRNELVTYLEKNNIQTRPLFSGNILFHPAFKNIPHRKIGKLSNATQILSQSFMIGLHHGLGEEQLTYMMEICEQFLKKL